MTRKILAVALAALPALSAARDLGPGTFELGGGTRFDVGSASTDSGGAKIDVSTTTLSADALFYVAKGFGLGLGVAFDRSKTEATFTLLNTPTTVETERTQLVIGPEAKLSLAVAPRVSVLLLGEAGWMTLDESVGASPGTATSDGWAVLGGGGLRFFLADFVSLDALFQYSYASLSGDVDVTPKGWDVGLALSFFLGGR